MGVVILTTTLFIVLWSLPFFFIFLYGSVEYKGSPYKVALLYFFTGGIFTGVYITGVNLINIIVDMVVTSEFQVNFGDSSYIYVLLYSLTLIMVINHIIYSEKINIYELKSRILGLWVNFKQNPFEFLLEILLIYFFFWMLIVLVGLIFGLTLNITNWPLFYFTLAARIVFVKLLFYFVLLVFTRNREQ